MTVLMTGASGLIGSGLAPFLRTQGHEVIPLRRAADGAGEAEATWQPDTGRLTLPKSLAIEAVIHLAGETIAQRWTAAAKARIRNSRVEGTFRLCAALARLPRPPKVLLCASAIGFYGSRGDEILDESSVGGTGFLAEVCREWEAAAAPARECGMRVVHLRLGIVLTSRGGALGKMLPVFKLGFGGPAGDGRQYWSWISMADLQRVALMALSDERLSGPVNAVAPHPVTNREFSRLLGRRLRRPAFLPMPVLAIRLLLGKMGVAMLMSSTRVLPARLSSCGFVFEDASLEPALGRLL